MDFFQREAFQLMIDRPLATKQATVSLLNDILTVEPNLHVLSYGIVTQATFFKHVSLTSTRTEQRIRLERNPA